MAKFAGLMLGVMIGGPLGPVVGVTGLNDPTAATIGIRVDDGRLILDGVVAGDAEREHAKEVLERIPGVKA